MHLHLLSETHQASLPSYGPSLPPSVSLILYILLLQTLQILINPIQQIISAFSWTGDFKPYEIHGVPFACASGRPGGAD